MSREVTSPETSRLFDVTEGADKLLEQKATTFYSRVKKILCKMKRSKPYIEAAIYFICTQVKDPDIHNWVRLRRVSQLQSQTIGDDRVIESDNIYEVLTYLDA